MGGVWCDYITVCPTYVRSMAFVCYSLNPVCVKEVHEFQLKINIKKNSKPFPKSIIWLAFNFSKPNIFCCFSGHRITEFKLLLRLSWLRFGLSDRWTQRDAMIFGPCWWPRFKFTIYQQLEFKKGSWATPTRSRAKKPSHHSTVQIMPSPHTSTKRGRMQANASKNS